MQRSSSKRRHTMRANSASACVWCPAQLLMEPDVALSEWRFRSTRHLRDTTLPACTSCRRIVERLYKDSVGQSPTKSSHEGSPRPLLQPHRRRAGDGAARRARHGAGGRRGARVRTVPQGLGGMRGDRAAGAGRRARPTSELKDLEECIGARARLADALRQHGGADEVFLGFDGRAVAEGARSPASPPRSSPPRPACTADRRPRSSR